MTVIRPMLLLMGLIGSGSVFWGIAFKLPVTHSPGTHPEHVVTASDGIVTDHGSHARPACISVDYHNDIEAVLVISSREAPRRESRLTIDVEIDGNNPCPVLSWQPILRPARATPEVTSRMLAADDGEIVVTTPASPKSEQWFLPGESAARERTAAVQTIEVADAPRVRVVLDQNLSDDVLLQDRCRRLAARMSSAFIPAVEPVFGPIADSETRGKLTVVVTPLVRQMSGGDSPIEAFVLATDFREDLVRPFGNERDAIYVHPELSAEKSDAVLIHELTHVAQFCAFRREYGSSPWPFADWILEGTAHAAESLLTSNLHNVKDRLDAFAAAPERSPLRVMDATREKLWRDPRCRGAACSFFTWMGRQYGLPAVGQIVTEASGSRNAWHTATGKDRDDLVRDWQASLIANRSVHMHQIQTGRALTLTVLGGASAFVRLPEATRGNRITVRIESLDSSEWACWLHGQRHSTSSEATGDDYGCGMGVAFTSPVTTIR